MTSTTPPTAATLLLQGRNLSRRERSELRALLRLGPWAWPRSPAEREALAAALERSATTDAVARPGQALLLAADDDGAGASVLLLDLANASHGVASGGAGVAFGAAARSAWQDGHRALAEGLPLRWRSLDGLAAAPPPATRLARHRRADHPHRDGADLVDGPSFGLGFALAMASQALGIELHGDVCAMAAVDGQGRLLPVGGVGAKLAALATLPGVRRVLVAPEQAGPELDAQLPEGISIAAVATVVGAVEMALARPVTSAIADELADPARRGEWIDALFRLALDGHGRVSHWPPIMRAAALAREVVGNALSADDRVRLELAHAIAARHAKVQVPMPALAAIARWPLPRRLVVLAHAVQHAADTADPDLETLAPLVLPLLPRDEDATADQCRLAGAWGRLLAVRAEPVQALAWQRVAVAQRMLLGEERGASQPLCECLRLGGLLHDAEAVAAARATWTRCEAIGAVGQRDAPYLAWADAHAALGLGEADAAERFAALCGDRGAPLHLRLSSARRLCSLMPAHPAANALLAGSGLDAGGLGHRDLFAALVALDRTIDGEVLDDATLRRHLTTIERELPGPLRHLHAAMQRRGDHALDSLVATVVRHFPY